MKHLEEGRNTLWVQLDKKPRREILWRLFVDCRNTLWVQLDKKASEKVMGRKVLKSQYSMSAIR